MTAPRLKEKFNKEIVAYMKERFQYKSVMEVPRLEKICINKGVGKAREDKKMIDEAIEEISMISGQKAVSTLSKNAISNFKLRENMPIGVKVTLRGDKMYEFLDRLINISLPRVRDFKGISDKAFDGRGNYTLGVKEQIIFPEISIEKVKYMGGMDITFVSTANTDVEAYELLKAFGMPFASTKKTAPVAEEQTVNEN